MVVDIAILLGIVALGYMNWRLYGDIQELGNVVAHMLIELGEKGIVKVEIEEDA